ncbi:MAG TPA: hypothetical protein PK289_00120 [Bacteroidia bacterium]|nr:hypothetical protein [Bacteroidia bacterium]
MDIKDSKVNGYQKTSITSVIGVKTIENVIAKTQMDAYFTAKYTDQMLMKAGITNSIEKLNKDALKN